MNNKRVLAQKRNTGRRTELEQKYKNDVIKDNITIRELFVFAKELVKNKDKFKQNRCFTISFLKNNLSDDSMGTLFYLEAKFGLKYSQIVAGFFNGRLRKCVICKKNWIYYKHTCSKECEAVYRYEQTKKVLYEKYGVYNASKLDDVRKKLSIKQKEKAKTASEKRKKTNLERYGVEYISQLNWVKEKQNKTKIKRYGSKNNINKIKETNLKKYGTDNVSKVPKIHLKKVKSSYRIKKVIVEGYNFNLQGYELFGLSDLLLNFSPDLIDGQKYLKFKSGDVHYVDFLVANTIAIEIKSAYTFNKDFDKVIRNAYYTQKEYGYDYYVWVYNEKGEKYEYKLDYVELEGVA